MILSFGSFFKGIRGLGRISEGSNPEDLDPQGATLKLLRCIKGTKPFLSLVEIANCLVMKLYIVNEHFKSIIVF